MWGEDKYRWENTSCPIRADYISLQWDRITTSLEPADIQLKARRWLEWNAPRWGVDSEPCIIDPVSSLALTSIWRSSIQHPCTRVSQSPRDRFEAYSALWYCTSHQSWLTFLIRLLKSQCSMYRGSTQVLLARVKAKRVVAVQAYPHT